MSVCPHSAPLRRLHQRFGLSEAESVRPEAEAVPEPAAEPERIAGGA
ncbi:hypothetical protein [Streptomyces sp. A1277]|nr:hypothetical protein [Streptomyces sp. A1277]